MSRWRDTRRWAALVDGSACPICRSGQPLDIVVRLQSGWLTCPEAAPMRGYVCLVSARHVVELHELSAGEGGSFMRDAQRISQLLSALPGVVKINYEIHGNTIPHLHMHFYVRYSGDIFEGRPINPRAVTAPVYAPGEHATFLRHLRSELAAEREVGALPTAKDIDVLLAFLPGFVERSGPFADWKGGGTSSDGVITLPHPYYAPDVSAFFRLAAQECWSDHGYRPDVAGHMLEDDATVDRATLAEIRTMLTYCVRGEKFCDGHREAVLHSGRLVALLTRLQALRREMADS